MKLINSKIQEDMNFGQKYMFVTTPDADIKENTDFFIGNLRIAYRTRRPSVNKYGELSIRNDRKSGAKTERQKILDGECKAKLFIWEFPDAYIICTFSDIYSALKNDIGYAKNNNDGVTSAYYIPLSKINHLKIPLG